MDNSHMHIEEAVWIRSTLDGYKTNRLSPLLNIGSSTKKFRSIDQPYIESEIFTPLQSRGVDILHSDIKNADGVDLVGDITDKGFRENLKQRGVSSILCSNMLEHVENRDVIAANIIDSLSPGGLLIITVPYKYPKHLDPIDTMYRPSPRDIATLFIGSELLNDEVLTVGKPITSLLKSPTKFSFLLLRCLVPFYKHRGWITAINKLLYLFKNRTVSCVILKKIDN